MTDIGAFSDLPRVTVIVPVRNEAEHVRACLDSILSHDYPPDFVDVLVVDGESQDGTGDVVRDVAESNPRVRLLTNSRRIQAAGLNIGLRAATAPVVARVDARARWPEGFLRHAVSLLFTPGVVAVGGGPKPVCETSLHRAIAAAFDSPLAIGAARHHHAAGVEDVRSVYSPCFRRDAVLAVGGYDEGLQVHEDFELFHRLLARGGRVLYSPQLDTPYYLRPGLRSLARQFMGWGRGKGAVTRRSPRVLSPYHLAPPALAVALGGSAAASITSRPARRMFLAVAGIYSAFVLAATMSAGRNLDVRARAWLFITLPTMHLSWGAGFIRGLLLDR
jgi:hypothetical protein